jgi:hypothetical protein
LEDHLDADQDDAPLRLRSIRNTIGQAAVPGQVIRRLEQGHLFAVSADEPSSLEEAEQDPSWKVAMRVEIKAIEESNTSVLTELSAGRKAIGLKWIFKVKRDEQGTVVKHKARLVVKGYPQRQGIDYDEVFAIC